MAIALEQPAVASSRARIAATVRRATSRRSRVALLTDDPYVWFLLSLHFPSLEAVRMPPAATARQVAALRPNVVLADEADARGVQLFAHGYPVVTLSDDDAPESRSLRRPVDPGELCAAVRRALVRPSRRWLAAVAAAVAVTAGALFTASVLGVWVALIPIAAGAGAYVSRSRGNRGRAQIRETHRALSGLYEMARAAPAALDARRVTAAVLEELRQLGADAGAVVMSDAGSMTASFGLDDEAVRTGDFGGGRWTRSPLQCGDMTLGHVVARWINAKPDKGKLERLATETAAALENARLFSRVSSLAADHERRRVARELHDGVAQALAHVRMELEYLARHEADPAKFQKEARRLIRVAERAQADVRAAIRGLRPDREAGLPAALGSYLDDLRGLGGPEIVYQPSGTVRLDADAELEVFRIAQEAVSNAVRHAGASRVTVTLDGDGATLHLQVADDGGGREGSTGSRAGGHGLRAMRERAAALGGKLEVKAHADGGTVVSLTVAAGMYGSHA